MLLICTQQMKTETRMHVLIISYRYLIPVIMNHIYLMTRCLANVNQNIPSHLNYTLLDAAIK